MKRNSTVIYPKSFDTFVDMQYAKSRRPVANSQLGYATWIPLALKKVPYYYRIPKSPRNGSSYATNIIGRNVNTFSGYNGLADYSSSTIANFINRLIAEQKARIGRFLTYDKLLINLRDRAETIRKVNPSVGTALVGRVNNAMANQKRLEGDGFGIFAQVGAIQKNPIILMLMKEKVDRSVISDELFLRGRELVAQLQDLTSQSAVLNSSLGDHEQQVSRLEKDIESVEGDLAERGLLRKTAKIGTEAIGKVLKYALIPAGIIGALYLMPKLKGAKK